MAGSILGYGVYIPRYRIKREDIARAWAGGARGENSVPHVNEDVITMAVEAAQNALESADMDPAQIGAIYLGTASAPNIEPSSVGIIGASLGTSPEIDMVDFGASPRASVAALKACLDAVASGRIGAGLVIGSDFRAAPPGSELELSFGAGAGALIVGRGPGIAELEDIHSYSTSFRDSWRAAQDPYVRLFEPRFTREYGYVQHVAQAVGGLLGKSGSAIGDFQYVLLQEPDGRMPRTLARTLGVQDKQMEVGPLFSQVGDAGASSLFLGLAAVFEGARPGERVLAASYGSGVSDALSLRVAEGVDRGRGRARTLDYYLGNKEYIDYTTYLKNRGILNQALTPSRLGLPPMSPLVARESAELLRLIGARCRGCGYMNFPPSERKICVRCGNTEFDRVLLPRRGRIHTFCISYYLPPGFDESPLPLIIADLEDGTRHRALGTEMKPEEVAIDKPVELVVRRLATEDGASIYGNVFRFPR
ncbi:MAG: hydroxymethylglutaryl-CoA synthase [Dehalococcoidia bacterium]